MAEVALGADQVGAAGAGEQLQPVQQCSRAGEEQRAKGQGTGKGRGRREGAGADAAPRGRGRGCLPGASSWGRPSLPAARRRRCRPRSREASSSSPSSRPRTRPCSAVRRRRSAVWYGRGASAAAVPSQWACEGRQRAGGGASTPIRPLGSPLPRARRTAPAPPAAAPRAEAQGWGWPQTGPRCLSALQQNSKAGQQGGPHKHVGV